MGCSTSGTAQPPSSTAQGQKGGKVENAANAQEGKEEGGLVTSAAEDGG